MKALHLNIASKPHRDFGPVYTVAIVAGVITLLLMINNGQAAYRYLVNTRQTRAELARIEAEISREGQAAASIEASIARVDVKSLTAQTSYINTQIADRAFSWSQLLDDLERVVPRDVRLNSLNPAFDEKTRMIKLSMQFHGKTHNGLVNLLQAMLADPRFQSTFPTSESRNEDGSYSFQVSTMYRPVLGGSR